MPHSTHEKFLPMYNLQQQYIEKHLWEATAESDLIETRWESEVTGVENEDEDAALHVKTPLGAYEMAATYVLAADGARSAMRSMLGLRLQGENFEGHYVIADVRMDHDYPTERRALFAPESNPRGTVLSINSHTTFGGSTINCKPARTGPRPLKKRRSVTASALFCAISDITVRGSSNGGASIRRTPLP